MNLGYPTLNFMTCAETVRALSKSQNWPARLASRFENERGFFK